MKVEARGAQGGPGRQRKGWRADVRVREQRGQAAVPGRAREPQMGEGELGAIRAGRGDRHLDPPPDRDPGAELEQLQSDRAAGGVPELGVAQADAAQGLGQHVGE